MVKTPWEPAPEREVELFLLSKEPRWASLSASNERSALVVRCGNWVEPREQSLSPHG